jgi:mRNA turnover protein 4
MEPLLRSLGLTTTLKKGIIHLLKPYTICSTGNVLTPEQAKLLKLFQRPLAQFKIKVKAHWNKNNEQVQLFDLHDDDDDEQEQAEDNDEEIIEQDEED